MAEDDRTMEPKDGGEESGEEFGELLKYTLAGFGGGFLLGAALDKVQEQAERGRSVAGPNPSGEGEILLARPLCGEAQAGRRAEIAGPGLRLGQAGRLAVPWLSPTGGAASSA